MFYRIIPILTSCMWSGDTPWCQTIFGQRKKCYKKHRAPRSQRKSYVRYIRKNKLDVDESTNIYFQVIVYWVFFSEALQLYFCSVLWIVLGICTSVMTCVPAQSLQSCLTLWDPMECNPPGSSVHGILQARILEWVAMPFSRGSSWPRG